MKDPFEMSKHKIKNYEKLAAKHGLNLDLFLIYNEPSKIKNDLDNIEQEIDENETITVDHTDLWTCCKKIKKATGISTNQAMEYFIQAAEMLGYDLNDLSE